MCVVPMKIVVEIKCIALEADSSSFFIRFCSYSVNDMFFSFGCSALSSRNDYVYHGVHTHLL